MQVKVLGVLAMVDDGELDWKVISIRAQDALAPVLNDISDVEKHCPGVVSGKSSSLICNFTTLVVALATSSATIRMARYIQWP
jgi:hypothetical protein